MLYNLPNDLNLDFLIGSTLQMVGITRFAIYIYFDNQSHFVIESALMINEELIEVPCFDLTSLGKIIDRNITAVRNDEKNIYISFDEAFLKIFGNKIGYESYQFSSKKLDFVV